MEIWREIKGYEGRYFVSSYGRVKSIIGNEKILKEQPNNAGYYQVTLSKDGEIKKHLVHRLVAETFIPNPDNLDVVNHRDEVSCHNFVENLEWCSYEYNNNYGTKRERIANTIKTNNDKLTKGNYHTREVMQYALDGKYIKTYKSVQEASRFSGVNHSSIILCCKGERSRGGNFKWKYK